MIRTLKNSLSFTIICSECRHPPVIIYVLSITSLPREKRNGDSERRETLLIKIPKDLCHCLLKDCLFLFSNLNILITLIHESQTNTPRSPWYNDQRTYWKCWRQGTHFGRLWMVTCIIFSTFVSRISSCTTNKSYLYLHYRLFWRYLFV